MTDLEMSTVPPFPTESTGDIWGVWRQALCVRCQRYLFVSVVCVFRPELNVYVCCMCGPGCVSGDKVVLNMFAQGPQKEKGPLTQESVETQRLHTNLHTELFKH